MTMMLQSYYEKNTMDPNENEIYKFLMGIRLKKL